MPAHFRPSTDSFATWGILMSAGLSGQERAYHELLTSLTAWLHRYFTRRLPPASVDDAVQETLIALHTKRHTYEPKRPFGPWLVAIARYKWVDRLRRMRREAAASEQDGTVPSHETAVNSAIVLGRLLATLKPSQAEAIRLIKVQGLTVEEASALTGQSPSLVKVNIHRGLHRLARLASAEIGEGVTQPIVPAN